jgi:hypothetical protein
MVRSSGRRRLGRVVLPVLAGAFLWPPEVSLAKGPAPYGFQERYVVAGDVAKGRFRLSEGSLAPGGYVRAYLVPSGHLLDENHPPSELRTIPLDERLTPRRGRSIQVRFVVPDVHARNYNLVVCGEEPRCGRYRDDLLGGQITVVADRSHIPLWRRLNRFHGEIDYLRAQVLPGNRSLGVLQSRLAEVSKENAALEGAVRELREQLADSDDGSPAAVVALGVLGGLVGGLLGRLVPSTGGRRRGNGRTAGPLGPTVPLPQRRPAPRRQPRTPVR